MEKQSGNEVNEQAQILHAASTNVMTDIVQHLYKHREAMKNLYTATNGQYGEEDTTENRKDFKTGIATLTETLRNAQMAMNRIDADHAKMLKAKKESGK